MRIRLTELRKIIRDVLLESTEQGVYDDTVLPGEEADDELLAEPDLTDQEERDAYLDTKAKKQRKKSRLQARQKSSDEHAIVGHTGPLRVSGNGPGNKPYGRKNKRLKPKNAMNPRAIDEYDE